MFLKFNKNKDHIFNTKFKLFDIDQVDIIFMSFIYFGNTPASVPPVFDTTPCMKEMLNYEDCVYEYLINYLVLMYPTQK